MLERISTSLISTALGSKRRTALVGASSILVILLVGMGVFVSIVSVVYGTLEEEGQAIASRVGKNMVNPLWGVDREQAAAVLESELSSTGLGRIEIYESTPTGQVLFVERVRVHTPPAILSSIPEYRPQITVPIINGGEEIRAARITMTDRSLVKWVAMAFCLVGLTTTLLGFLTVLLLGSLYSLISARDKALAAERAKGDFLANMSHEIRTPMNGVLGMAQLLSESQLSNEQRDLVTSIQDSGTNLLRIINEILDVSKLDAGKLRLDPQPFSVRKMVNSIEKMFEVQVAQRSIILSMVVQPQVHEVVLGDELRISQIVINLVGNAIKFSPIGGGISVLVFPGTDPQIAHSVPGAELLHIAVSDSGIGIPADKRDLIFEAFSQADTSTTRKYGGTGLGLTITREIVHLMRGKIWVESKEGVGSSFHVILPLQVVTQSVSDSAQAKVIDPLPSVAGLRVLVAEDNLINQKLISKLLQKAGATVTVVGDGAEAVRAATSAQTPAAQFDIILMDCQMPNMSGYDAAQKIREFEGHTRCQPVPIIALTANVLPGERERCIESGMSDYSPKPIQREHLFSLINSLRSGS